MSNKIKIICAVVLLNFLTGCVGIGVFYPSYSECGYKKEDGLQFDKSIGGCPWASNFIKKEQILSRYGEPQKIEKINQSEEKWTYKASGFRWVGVMPIIIASIPIGVPVASKYENFYFKDDILFKKQTKNTKFLAAWCGLLGGKISTEKPISVTKKPISIDWWGCAAEEIY